MKKLTGIALMASKKGNIILTMILASLLPASFAGGHRKFMNKSTIEMEEVAKESPRKFPDNEEASIILESLWSRQMTMEDIILLQNCRNHISSSYQTDYVALVPQLNDVPQPSTSC